MKIPEASMRTLDRFHHQQFCLEALQEVRREYRRELRCANTTYTSDTGKVYDFNTVTKLNSLLVKVLINTGQLGMTHV